MINALNLFCFSTTGDTVITKSRVRVCADGTSILSSESPVGIGWMYSLLMSANNVCALTEDDSPKEHIMYLFDKACGTFDWRTPFKANILFERTQGRIEVKLTASEGKKYPYRVNLHKVGKPPITTFCTTQDEVTETFVNNLNQLFDE